MINAFIMVLIFIALLLVDTVIAIKWKRMRKLKKLLPELALCMFLILLMVHYKKLVYMDIELHELENGKMIIPWLFHTLLLGVIIVICLVDILFENKIKKTTITQSSIQESLEHMECGLCYGKSDGTLLLANHSMYELCESIFERNLGNVQVFWNVIISFGENDVAKRIDFTSWPAFLTRDGEVWSFQRSLLKDFDHEFVEIVARNVTRLYNQRKELVSENEKLEEVQKKLAYTLENIAKIGQEEELLSYKMRIHDQLGNTILQTGKMIDDENATKKDFDHILRMWEGILNGFSKNASMSEADSKGYIEEVRKIAGAIGCKIIIKGVLPHNSQALGFAMREALYNGVRHAGADTITITAERVLDDYEIVISDNGCAKSDKIVEGGGLSSIRKMIEAEGGAFECNVVNTSVELRIKLPVKE